MGHAAGLSHVRPLTCAAPLAPSRAQVPRAVAAQVGGAAATVEVADVGRGGPPHRPPGANSHPPSESFPRSVSESASRASCVCGALVLLVSCPRASSFSCLPCVLELHQS
eukprot:3270049-Rhodomonas_salina.1